MAQHNAFVVNTTIQMKQSPMYAVMCTHCGWKRPRKLFSSPDRDAASLVASTHAASHVVTDVLGRVIE